MNYLSGLAVKSLRCILLGFLFAGIISPALSGVGTWKSYTAKQDIRSVAVDSSGMIWAATSGGMFAYSPSTGTYRQFTTSEGLETNDLTAIAADLSGRIWIGASTGAVDVYDSHRLTWTYIDDISLLSAPQKSIAGFEFKGDTVYILSTIGVSVYQVNESQFGDTYARYGSAGSQIIGGVVSLSIYHDSIWVATGNGIAATPLNNPNPAAPESWEVFTRTQGLPSDSVSALVNRTSVDTLYAGTALGVAKYSNGAWITIPGTQGLNVTDLSYFQPVTQPSFAIPVDLIAITPGAVFRYNVTISSTSVTQINPGAAILPIALPHDNGNALSKYLNSIEVGTSNHGVLRSNNSAWVSILPPGPPTNHFIGIAVDAHGVLWSATDRDAPGEGFMSFDGTTWKSYTAEKDPRFANDTYVKISIGANDSKWAGNWGSGVALLNSAGALQRIFNAKNGLIPAYSRTDPDTNREKYVVIQGVAVDADGNTWIADRSPVPPTDTGLVVFRHDSTFSYVTGGGASYAPNVTDILIDQYSTKWLANFNRFEPGAAPTAFYYYNEKIALPGTSNGWGRLSASDGLASNQAWCLALGLAGELWVGSEQGISIIFDPSNPQANIALYHPLAGQVIQAIVTDPVDQKWVATRNGVFVMSPDGTSIVAQYTQENTSGQLLSDDITSIAINRNTGVMYFGTENGLSTLTTASVSPVASSVNLAISPNPFFLPAATSLKIDGLMQGSTIKILTVSGALVKNIQTAGGRVGYWDGTDQNGNTVASGIYIIVAVSGDGSTVTNGKVAVVRK